jgi:transcriptional regulator of acetoin/glycerol metabolism
LNRKPTQNIETSKPLKADLHLHTAEDPLDRIRYTAKELIAKAIHYNSSRKEGPFIKINCAALPEGLIESELFGHVRGSFTGAIKGSPRSD